ncbi:MAG TPA: hypothetical protein VMR41_03440 [Patescibacteria group bacterium]|nr:hypothetical protein [Patescibacteria group bacterium]
MDFKYQHTPDFRNWIVFAPRRSGRPDIAKGNEAICPFCPGNEREDEEVYRIQSKESRAKSLELTSSLQPQASNSDWSLRVVKNAFPFAPIHELIIHSPDHHRNIDELPTGYVVNLLKTYRSRYILHQAKGQVCIFHNRGMQAGESIPHAHSQLAVVPVEIEIDAQILLPENEQEGVKTKYFHIFSPKFAQWPDEVWLAPLKGGKRPACHAGIAGRFGEISDEEILDLAVCLPKVIRLLDLRHGHEFPFNYSIYPGANWYLRLIPRQKSLGGFEIGTGIFVNTQDPKETDEFLQAHFKLDEVTQLNEQDKAKYRRHA